jgi:hypothetical protein
VRTEGGVVDVFMFVEVAHDGDVDARGGEEGVWGVAEGDILGSVGWTMFWLGRRLKMAQDAVEVGRGKHMFKGLYWICWSKNWRSRHQSVRYAENPCQERVLGYVPIDVEFGCSRIRTR